jgi:hypothetical protein
VASMLQYCSVILMQCTCLQSLLVGEHCVRLKNAERRAGCGREQRSRGNSSGIVCAQSSAAGALMQLRSGNTSSRCGDRAW